MAAYVVAHVQINDPDGFREYTSRFAPTMAPFGGRVLAADDTAELLEGPWPSGRAVILEFGSVETARAWHQSDEYQRISTIRRANSDASMAIIAGL